MTICEIFPQIHFFFIFVIALYYLFFFKYQGILFVLVPTFDSDTELFIWSVVAIIVTEALHIIRAIYRQCNVELFFIDWENSKQLSLENDINSKPSQVISIWRSIFMSNEWARLQVLKC
jgi:hypothetical protein